jgi:UDP-galactopyranose mutase
LAADIVALSHLRWDWVFQRPQHLLSRFARDRRVFYVEEPGEPDTLSHLEVEQRDGVTVLRPRLRQGLDEQAGEQEQRLLLRRYLSQQSVTEPVLWFYTPMALPLTERLRPSCVVYDCMDELSLFFGAPPELCLREERLLRQTDLVFTGGASLYAAKLSRHPRVHLFPSSVDAAHFASAGDVCSEPPDQAEIARPRLGYYGVIDERIDLDLLAALADARPTWQIVMLGPIAKIDPNAIPRRPNLHLLGAKRYADLPAYLAGWDVALLPFAINDATRFISPTKTPEYLAAGRSVVSTAIADVVEPYGRLGLVRIGADPAAFIAACSAALDGDGPAHRRAVRKFLSGMSWDHTQAEMRHLLDTTISAKQAAVGGREVA